MVHLLRFNSGLTTYKIVVSVDQLTIQVYMYIRNKGSNIETCRGVLHLCVTERDKEIYR